MRLSDDSYEYIKEEVVALFEEYNIKTIPISGFELAHKMGLKIIPYSKFSESKQERLIEIDKDGFFTDYNGIETILFNDKANSKRANMTILHEIGHYVLGHTNMMNSEEAEAEAKFFAKYASAPPVLIHLLKTKSAENIACVFNLSDKASEIAFNYYQKWLKKREKEDFKLSEYEIKLWGAFKEEFK